MMSSRSSVETPDALRDPEALYARDVELTIVSSVFPSREMASTVNLSSSFACYEKS